MSNRLSDRDMLRVKACALVFLDSVRRNRIEQIAESKDIDLNDTAIMYTIGALNRYKRQGLARNYAQALDLLESEQVGDHYNPITKTTSAESLTRDINRINRINAGTKFHVDNTTIVHDYDNVAVVDGETVTIPHFTTVNSSKRERTPRKIGKVLGTLYTEWDNRQRNYDPALVMMDSELQHQYANIQDNLRRFFAEYASRLSKTAKTRLYEVAQSTIDPHYLMGKGRTDNNTKRESRGAYNLYRQFDHKDSLSCIDFIGLIRQYVK